MSEIANKVKQIVAEKLGVNESEVVESANFINDLGADSLDLTELVMELEKQFNINIPDTDSEKLMTVGGAVTYVTEHLSK